MSKIPKMGVCLEGWEKFANPCNTLRYPMSEPLSLSWLAVFISRASDRYPVRWT